MPFRPAQPCKTCGAAQLTGSYYCDEHKPIPAPRPSTYERGYDNDWKRFRKWFLGINPMCVDCEIKPSQQVHHIKKLREFPALRLIASNCLALCASCHSKRSAKGE